MKQAAFPHITAYAAITLLIAPMMIIAGAWLPLDIPNEFIYFFESGLVADYAINSIIITLGTAFCSIILGVFLAWCVTMVSFPFRTLFGWLLLLPLAIPSFIAAMIYGDALDSSGMVQQSIRALLGVEYGEYYFPSIRSIGGIIFILTITLYPYVYMAVRAAFLMQSQQMLETAKLLGTPKSAMLQRVMMPMARPAIVAGAVIVGMEALADYGVASLFGVPVLTTGIFRAWQGYYDPITAARLASLLFLFVLACISLERYSRKGARYHNVTALYHPLELMQLSRIGTWCVTLICSLVICVGVIFPVCTLIFWSFKAATLSLNDVMSSLASSAFIGGCVAAVCLMGALFFAYFQRYYASPKLKMISIVALHGYALPGTVIAVGVLVVCIALQAALFDGAPVLTASMMAVVWGCVIRFITVSYNNINASLQAVTPAMDDAAITLGYKQAGIMKHVHIPMIKGAIYTAFLLVFIDTVKELPATLLLRPYNMTTLAIKSFELAKDDLLYDAAPLALLLIGLSAVPVFLLAKKYDRSRPGGIS